jgi:hypothetical protein
MQLQDSMTKIAFSALSADITPRTPVPLSGYSGRAELSAGVDLPLEINALRMSEAGREVFLLSVDALFAGTFSKDVGRRLGDRKGASVLTLASHTHFAPSLDAGKTELGRFDAAHYENALDAAVALCLKLRENPASAALARGESSEAASLAINRRDRRWTLTKSPPFIHKSTVMAPNTSNPGHFPVTVYIVRAADGAGAGVPCAVLWHWTCHPVVSAPNRISSAFPGYVRKMLRQTIGAQVPVLFLQGFCGDVRPNLGIGTPSPKQRVMAFPGPVFQTSSREEQKEWLDALAGAVRNAFKSSSPPARRDGPLRFASASLPLSRFVEGAPKAQSVKFGILDVGGAMRLALVSAEALFCHGQTVAGIFGSDTLPVGYWDDCFGYLPSDRQVTEGGYEVDGFMPHFSLSGKFRAGVDALIGDALRGLL